MRLNDKLSNLRLAVLLGGSIGLAAGCILDLNGAPSTECGGVLSHSEMVGDDCVCDAGYEWCNPGVEDDYSCCEYEEPCASGENNHLDENQQCECDPGFTWCSPDDLEDLNCCAIDPDSGTDGTDSASGDGDGDTSGTGDGDGDTGTDGVLPPEDCTPEQEGSFWCTHTVAMGPVGSQTFECIDGLWVENPEWPELDCTSSDFDFGVGCVYDEELMEYQSVCEYGPGDPCDEGTYAPNCGDSDLLLECFYTKVKSTSCQEFCETIGVMGMTFEMGICEEVDGVSDCSCFDSP